MASIRTSPYFNDPAFAQAAANLAGLFEPPSGADAAGWAAANAKNAEAKRLADLFDMSQRADLNPTAFDRGNVAAGNYAPTQSYYAVDAGDATARRGQDVTAATSRLNNADDNQRAIVTSRYGTPLSQGQVLPEMPGGIAGLYGLPPIQAAAGAPKPLSQDEVAAQRQQDAYSKGMLSDQDFVDALVGKETPVQIQGPNGPVYSTPGEAVRTAAPAYVNKGAQARPTNGMAVMNDGTRVAAVQDETGRWRAAQTGAELPPDVRIFDTPKPQGSLEEVGGTTANQTSANNRRAELTRTLGTIDLYEGIIDNNPGVIGLPGLIRGTAQNTAAVLEDTAAAFGKSVPELQDATAKIRAELEPIAPELFDPNISAADFLQGTLAYALARTENPSGEVSRQALEAATRRLRGGFLQNSRSAKAALQTFRQMLNTEVDAIGVLDDPSKARTDTTMQGGAPAASERWERVNGVLQKVQ